VCGIPIISHYDRHGVYNSSVSIPSQHLAGYGCAAVMITASPCIHHPSYTIGNRAVIYSLKVFPDDENDKSPCLVNFRNNFVDISSFNVSQKDMLDSVVRVAGTSEKDWKADYEDVKERYKNRMEEFKKGSVMSFAKLLYSRVFSRTGAATMRQQRLAQ
jgi:hypothetical protein